MAPERDTRIAWIKQSYTQYCRAADPGDDTADAIGLAEWYVKEVISYQLVASLPRPIPLDAASGGTVESA